MSGYMLFPNFQTQEFDQNVVENIMDGVTTTSIGEDSDSWVSKIPDEAQIDMSLMRLGKERYDIHCAICHGTYGNGNGVMKEFLGVAPRNLSDPELTNYLEPAGRIPDGKIFHTISMGAGNMLGLKDKLSPKERWAIVLYVRTLQSYVSEAQSSAKN